MVKYLDYVGLELSLLPGDLRWYTHRRSLGDLTRERDLHTVTDMAGK